MLGFACRFTSGRKGRIYAPLSRDSGGKEEGPDWAGIRGEASPVLIRKKQNVRSDGVRPKLCLSYNKLKRKYID